MSQSLNYSTKENLLLTPRGGILSTTLFQNCPFNSIIVCLGTSLDWIFFPWTAEFLLITETLLGLGLINWALCCTPNLFWKLIASFEFIESWDIRVFVVFSLHYYQTGYLTFGFLYKVRLQAPCTPHLLNLWLWVSKLSMNELLCQISLFSQDAFWQEYWGKSEIVDNSSLFAQSTMNSCLYLWLFCFLSKFFFKFLK